MLKRGDRAFDELIAQLKEVTALRFVQDPKPIYSPFYMVASGDEPSFAFASLNRTDRLKLLAEMIPWREYGREGITAAQQRVIISNVLDGKLPERWLQGVFDPDVQQKAFRDLVRNDSLMARKEGRELDRFDRSIADLRKKYRDDGFGDTWNDLSAEEKVRYLATFAQAYDVPVDRFCKAAQHVLGGIELSEYDNWFVRNVHGKHLATRPWEVSIFGDRRTESAETPGVSKTQERGGRER